eukprot:6192767-Pleurochrysis_carterae.AAC.5
MAQEQGSGRQEHTHESANPEPIESAHPRDISRKTRTQLTTDAAARSDPPPLLRALAPFFIDGLSEYRQRCRH